MPGQKEDAIIQVRALDAWYGEHKVLEDINLDIHAGEIMGIMGGSGWGESRLLR
jgi:phospholipid/cholesterol/gamma-HCH transport system ATP-binding protein